MFADYSGVIYDANTDRYHQKLINHSLREREHNGSADMHVKNNSLYDNIRIKREVIY